MAGNAYLLLSGVEGPSTSVFGAIDILQFAFRASQTSVIGAGSSGGESRAGRASLGDILIDKAVDATSPILFHHCVTGTYFERAEIDYCKPMEDRQEEYYKIELAGVMITHLKTSGVREHPSETICFAYSQINVNYNHEIGGILQGWLSKGFDALTLKPIRFRENLTRP